MLEGLIIKPLTRFADERGFFAEILRRDWEVVKDEVSQANLSITYPNIVRAWHKHERGQVDYLIVLRGALKICVYDEETRELDEIVSTGENLQIVRVPGKYWHGFKAIGNEPAFLVYFVNNLYNYRDPDELRRPWNDQAIVPRRINGREDDSRCNKPWDWFHLPFK